jgi:murein DD-endopeptidase MepM/ murein hydrolase activator NlpD
MSRRTLVAVGSCALLGGLAFASTLTGMLLMVAGQSSTDLPEQCAPEGAVPVSYAGPAQELDPAQRAHAQAIIAEGYRLAVPRQGIVIALAVARQESGFKNYANDGKGDDLADFQHGIETSLALPHEAVGTDHGSLGVFQQQWPWWGSMEDLMTPAKAADKFYNALLAVPSWQSMSPSAAGQAVQRSAYPDAYPDAYADDVPIAEQLLGDAGPAPDTNCALDAVGVGIVVEPLAPGVRFTDLHNFGNSGSHWAHGHTGTDLSAACGAPVVAATNGTVTIRTDQTWAGRWLVEVSTGPGRLTTWYAHMRAITVRPDERVIAGQQLGEVGDLGNATGCHLHFEVHPDGGDMYVDEVDPSAWLARSLGRHLSGILPAASTSGAFTVATFNALGNSHTAATGKDPGKASGPARTRGVIELLKRYDVDVIGLQEFQRPQYRAFVALAGDHYALYFPKGDTENAIAWNPARFHFVSAGSFSIPYFDGHPRLMPIVRLEDLQTGQELAFVNVHNPADTRRFPQQAAFRALAVEREVALVDQLEKQRGLPVILTGDLNDSHDAFCTFGYELSMTSASGGSTSPDCRPPAHAGIDWIFGTQKVGFGGYLRDDGQLVRQTSDHPIVTTRVQIGGAR